MRRERARVVEPPYRSNEEKLVDRILMATLEAPSGVAVELVFADGERMGALLPAVPHANDGLWMAYPRNASSRRRFIVEHVEWKAGRHPSVALHLLPTPCPDEPRETDRD